MINLVGVVGYEPTSTRLKVDETDYYATQVGRAGIEPTLTSCFRRTDSSLCFFYTISLFFGKPRFPIYSSARGNSAYADQDVPMTRLPVEPTFCASFEASGHYENRTRLIWLMKPKRYLTYQWRHLATYGCNSRQDIISHLRHQVNSFSSSSLKFF